jgi:hypothetical protein
MPPALSPQVLCQATNSYTPSIIPNCNSRFKPPDTENLSKNSPFIASTYGKAIPDPIHVIPGDILYCEYFRKNPIIATLPLRMASQMLYAVLVTSAGLCAFLAIRARQLIESALWLPVRACWYRLPCIRLVHKPIVSKNPRRRESA